MTREEAISKAINIVSYFEAHFAKSKEARKDATDIIEALEQEPCTDAISREAVKNIIRGGVCTDTEADIEYVCGLIDGLPSVATSEKVGQWIPTGYDGYADGNPVYDWWECSECGEEHTGDEDTLTQYCPHCGAKMQEVHNENAD